MKTLVAKPESKKTTSRGALILYRTGKYDPTTKTQRIIVKFTSHSFKEQVYFKRKTKKNSDSNIRITPSLTHHQLELLNLTQSYLQEEYHNKKDNIYPKFTFADVHGNLKLWLNQTFKNRSVFTFSSVSDFHQVINKVTTRSSYPYQDEICLWNWLTQTSCKCRWIGRLKCCQDNPFTVFSEVYLSSMVFS